MKNYKNMVAGIIAISYSSFGFSQNWTQIESGTSNKLNCIEFIGDEVGYIGGNDSLLLKTIDGGVTWIALEYTGVDFMLEGDHILNLDFVTEEIGYMTVGPYTGSYKTIDGGLSWTNLDPWGSLCYNRGLYFFDENNGFVGGGGCFSSEMFNRFQNGVSTIIDASEGDFSAHNHVVDIDFYTVNFGLAASGGNVILRTIDAGISWTKIPLSSPEGIIVTSVEIIDENICFAGFSQNIGEGGLLMSTDGGLTWDVDILGGNVYSPRVYGLHENEAGTFFAVGTPYPFATANQGMIFSSNDLVDWTFDLVDFNINSVNSIRDSVVYAVGDSGYIVVNYPLSNQQAGFSINKLEENSYLYPNPTQDVLFLKGIKENEVQFIQIIDPTGKIILESHEFNSFMDVSACNPGVYFLNWTSVNGTVHKERFQVNSK